MEATLRFNLPEDNEEFLSASKGGHYLSAIHALDDYLRGRIKYEELTEPVQEALQAARDRLWQEVNDE